MKLLQDMQQKKEGRLCTQIGLGSNTELESCLTLGKFLHLAELYVHLLKRGSKHQLLELPRGLDDVCKP